MMETPCWEGLKTWDSDDPGRYMPTAYGHDHNGGIVADCLGIHQSFRKPRPILHNPARMRTVRDARHTTSAGWLGAAGAAVPQTMRLVRRGDGIFAAA